MNRVRVLGTAVAAIGYRLSLETGTLPPGLLLYCCRASGHGRNSKQSASPVSSTPGMLASTYRITRCAR